MNILILRRIPKSSTEAKLSEMVKACGQVVRAVRVPGKEMDMVHVYYRKDADAAQAKVMLHGQKLGASPKPIAAYQVTSKQLLLQTLNRMTEDMDLAKRLEAANLVAVDLTWDDCARTKSSAMGPNISDVTLGTDNGDCLRCPVIRSPNFHDLSYDVPMEKITVWSGNHRQDWMEPKKGKEGSGLTPDPDLVKTNLKAVLQNLRSHLSDPASWPNGLSSLYCEKMDANVIASPQACFLPVEPGDEIAFSVNIANYQTSFSNPRVLVLVLTRHGMSCQVIRKNPQRIQFNQYGETASLVAQRLKDNRKARGVAIEGEMKKEEREENMICIVQIPLKPAPPAAAASRRSAYQKPPITSHAMFGAFGVSSVSVIHGDFGFGGGGVMDYYGPDARGAAKRAASEASELFGGAGDSDEEGPVAAAQDEWESTGEIGGACPSPSESGGAGAGGGGDGGGGGFGFDFGASDDIPTPQGGGAKMDSKGMEVFRSSFSLAGGESEQKDQGDHAIIRVSKPTGKKFKEMDGVPVERDERFPVRVTMQFYKIVGNASIGGKEIQEIVHQFATVKALAVQSGSLVTDKETKRTTDWSEKALELTPSPPLTPSTQKDKEPYWYASYPHPLVWSLLPSNHFCDVCKVVVPPHTALWRDVIHDYDVCQSCQLQDVQRKISQSVVFE